MDIFLSRLSFFSSFSLSLGDGPGWSGGAKVLDKLPVPGRPTYLDYSRARAYCACSRCGGGCLDIFPLIYHFSFLSPSLWKTARYRLKYCLKGPLSPKQPTNQLGDGPIKTDIMSQRAVKPKITNQLATGGGGECTS